MKRVTLRHRLRNQEAGLSLIELMIAMMLMLVVMGATYGIWNGISRTYAFTEDDLTAQDQARQAMGEMVEFIRTARRPATAPTEALKAVIVEGGPNHIVIWVDADKDVNHDLELLRFRVDTDDRTLWRDEADVSGSFLGGTSHRLVTTHVSNTAADPLFTYGDTTGSPIPTDGAGNVVDVTAIRQVTLDLMVDIYPDQAPVIHRLTSVVQPRNLRQY